jgi:hypothetical protein
MPGSVPQWTIFALVKKTSLHFDCWKTTDGLARQVTTWRDLRGLLYSHSDIVCLLIQSNCIELHTINKYFNMGCVTFRSLCFMFHENPSDGSNIISEAGPRTWSWGRSPTEATRLRFDQEKSRLHLFMASRHRIVVALVGEAPLRTEGSTSRRL